MTTTTLSLVACGPAVRDWNNAGGAGGEGSAVTATGPGGQGGTGGTGGTGGGGTGGTGGFGGNLPACTGSQNVVLAIDKLFLGDVNPDGTPNPSTGWKQYGTNIDGLISDKTSTGLCKPTAGGSPAAVYPDGFDGIDNAFGKNILPIMLGLSSDMSVIVNEGIAMGKTTYLLSILNVTQEPPCETWSTLFKGGDLGKPPLFDGSDAFPIDPVSLWMPPDPTSVKTKFPSTVVAPGVVMTLPPHGELDLHLNLSGFPLILPIKQARLLMDLSPDQKSATNGQISGIVPKEALVEEIAKVAAAFDVSFCDPVNPTLQAILHQMRQAADIMVDGTHDPSMECDGISIGIGFTMKPAKIGDVAPVAPPPPDPCGP